MLPQLTLNLLLAAIATARYVTVTEVEVVTIVVPDGQSASEFTLEMTHPTAVPQATQPDNAETTADAAAEAAAETTAAAQAPATQAPDAPAAPAAPASLDGVLAAHNNYRAKHSAPALEWDASLAAYAANYAAKYDCSGTLTHSGGPWGENLALGYTPTAAVDAWYSEGANYNYGSTCSVYDHFTQIVWVDTQRIGCAIKNCGNYWGDYLVCSYDPPGNYIGECAKNVLPN